MVRSIPDLSSSLLPMADIRTISLGWVRCHDSTHTTQCIGSYASKKTTSKLLTNYHDVKVKDKQRTLQTVISMQTLDCHLTYKKVAFIFYDETEKKKKLDCLFTLKMKLNSGLAITL